MKIKSKIKELCNNPIAIKWFKIARNALISALFGFGLGKLLGDNWQLGLTIIVPLGFLVIVFSIIVQFVENKLSIIRIIKKDLAAKDYREVLKLGFPLSRALFVASENTIRVEIGTILSKALEGFGDDNETIEINEKERKIGYIRSCVLIDDLGWSKYLLEKEKCSAAIDNIEDGIDIAIRLLDWGQAIKGYRHLAGIAIEKNDFDKINKMLSKIEEILSSNCFSKLAETDKMSIMAGLSNLYAKVFVKRAKKQATSEDEKKKFLAQALEEAEKYERYYVLHSKEKHAKYYCLKGEILLEYKDRLHVNAAIDCFIQGRNVNADENRRDNYIRATKRHIEALITKYHLNASDYVKDEKIQQLKALIRQIDVIMCELDEELPRHNAESHRTARENKKVCKNLIKEIKKEKI